MAIPAIIAGLMKAVPIVAGLIGGNDAEDKARKAVDIAKAVTGEADPDKAVQALQKDPQAALKYKEALIAHDAVMAREESRRIAEVNATMQAEAKSEKWPQYAWRPFNGFMFGVTLFANYVLLPAFSKSPTDIPEIVWIMWGSVLGVTAWHRGKEKRGESASAGIAGIVKGAMGRR